MNPRPVPYKGTALTTELPVYNESLVPGAGLEPARSYEHWVLNPARLPITPPRHTGELVSPVGFEPTRSYLQGILSPLGLPVPPRRHIFERTCSTQLIKKSRWAQQDSNLQSTAYEAAALTNCAMGPRFIILKINNEAGTQTLTLQMN